MPYRRNKRFVKKQFKRQYNKKSTSFSRKRKYSASNKLVTYMPKGQLPIPPRYRCKLACNAQFAIDSSAMVNDGAFQIVMNSVNLPYTVSGLGSTPYVGFSPQTPITLQPTGYSQLANAITYNRFRVYASKIMMKFIPSALSDTIMVTLTPSSNSLIPLTTGDALSQPYTRSKLFQANQNGIIKSYLTQHKFVGTTKSAMEDDLSGQYISNFAGTPATPIYWVVNWNTVDGSDLATPVVVDIQLDYYVELFANNSSQMVDT